jgi:hypothetical protein
MYVEKHLIKYTSFSFFISMSIVFTFIVVFLSLFWVEVQEMDRNSGQNQWRSEKSCKIPQILAVSIALNILCNFNKLNHECLLGLSQIPTTWDHLLWSHVCDAIVTWLSSTYHHHHHHTVYHNHPHHAWTTTTTHHPLQMPHRRQTQVTSGGELSTESHLLKL